LQSRTIIPAATSPISPWLPLSLPLCPPQVVLKTEKKVVPLFGTLALHGAKGGGELKG